MNVESIKNIAKQLGQLHGQDLHEIQNVTRNILFLTTELLHRHARHL